MVGYRNTPFSNLSKELKEEFRKIANNEILANLAVKSEATEGRDFWEKYEIKELENNLWAIVSKKTGEIFGDYTHESKTFIEAILWQVCQNYGR